MERKEKGVDTEGKGKKKEGDALKGKKKLKVGMVLQVGKRGGPSTPSPTWRLEFSCPSPNEHNHPIREFLNTTTAVSARKLCANFWEIQPQVHHSLSKINKNLGHDRRRNHYSSQHHKERNPFELRTQFVDPPKSPPDQPSSVCSLRKHVTSFMQHHRSVGRNGHHAQRPLSTASSGSSQEVAPYNPAAAATSPSYVKGRIGESSYNLKTSTELLKVLNRIWSLEEQQASNISLLRALKIELDHSQSQIKELINEKQASRQEMDRLMKQLVYRKNKEQDRIKSAVHSLQEELEDERKLRKHSESLRQKLSRELSEVKYSFSNALKEFERERKARFLLENLCDEFAKGIRDYEREVRSLRHKSVKDNVGREKPDRLVLHISEAWLDERMQMKLAEAEHDPVERNTIVDKLGLDIETFLQATHSVELRKDWNLYAKEGTKNCSRRESFPLNEAASAPQDVADEDSTGSDSSCFELDKSASKRQNIGYSKQQLDNASDILLEKIVDSNSMKRTDGSRENAMLHNPVNFRVQFEEQMAGERLQFPDRGQGELGGESQGLINNSHTSNISEVRQSCQHERKTKRIGNHVLKANYMLDTLVRNHSLSSEGDNIHPEGDFMEDACVPRVFIGHVSPVQQWMSKLTPPEFDKSESSLKLATDLKENTLKAKLLEARLETQKSHLRASKAPLHVDGEGGYT